MSVTFFCPGSPTATVPCPYCAEAVAEGGRACVPWCEGLVEVTAAPESNFSNANARVLINLLGLNYISNEEDLAGEIPPELLPEVVRTTIRLLNSPERLQDAVHLPRRSVGDNGAIFMEVGVSLESIRERIRALQELFLWAADRNLPVCYS